MDNDKIDAEKLFVRSMRFRRIVDINMVRVFFAVFLAVSLIALIPFLRPRFSASEKRELHKFPKFSVSALFSGSYFDDIGLWYSDTFPLRDDFVIINSKLNSLFGIKSVEIHGDVKQTNADPAKPDKTGDLPGEDKTGNEDNPDTTIEKIGAMAIVGNAGYEYYNFDKSATDLYVSAINRAADKLSGKCRVFEMVVPTSIAVTLDESIAAQMNSSDQETAIDYIYANMSKNAVCVDAVKTLKKHRDEYLYFRTDHHWTAHAAYYSYLNLMEAAGKDAADLSAFKEYVFEGFLGTFYATSNMSGKLGAKPDTVYAYEPQGIEFIHTFEKGFEKDYHIVSNADKLSSSEKYLTFICGDHPLGVMTNEQIAGNSSCLIVKESFGNAMAAYFTQNYRITYVVDLRKIKSVYAGDIGDFVNEHGIDDVFFINNISATRNRQISKNLLEFIGE